MRPDIHKEIDRMTVTCVKRFSVDVNSGSEQTVKNIESEKQRTPFVFEFIHRSFGL
jgi:hypothetical protein